MNSKAFEISRATLARSSPTFQASLENILRDPRGHEKVLKGLVAGVSFSHSCIRSAWGSNSKVDVIV